MVSCFSNESAVQTETAGTLGHDDSLAKVLTKVERHPTLERRVIVVDILFKPQTGPFVQ